MKKLNLYLVTPVIILAVMYSLGYMRLERLNPFLWGDKTTMFLIAAAVLIYLLVLAIENAIKNKAQSIMIGIATVVFVVVGFWALVLYYSFTPRIGGKSEIETTNIVPLGFTPTFTTTTDSLDRITDSLAIIIHHNEKVIIRNRIVQDSLDRRIEFLKKQL